eukprot:7899914-Alexandrium_andersonii.AAC.1
MAGPPEEGVGPHGKPSAQAGRWPEPPWSSACRQRRSEGGARPPPARRRGHACLATGRHAERPTGCARRPPSWTSSGPRRRRHAW